MTFDDSLPRFVDFIVVKISAEVASQSLFLRDPAGKLTCVISPHILNANQREEFSVKAAEELTPYVENDGFAISTAEELLDERLGDASVGIKTCIHIRGKEIAIRLLDRRVMGGAWLERQTEISQSRRLVFASLKGGVGRSTALCVLAAELATSGYRVLAIDMDVEAPGIGSMLLTDETLPKFGLLDYLVESSLQTLDAGFYTELIAPSWLAEGRGIVSVIPAMGSVSLQHPENILSKIARAYLNDKNDDSAGVTKKIRLLLDHIDESREYDVVLLDARAGLHETTGSALLGLGGRILLFGTDQKQTETGFNILFENLAIVEKSGWQDRLVVVHSKATTNAVLRNNFIHKVQESFSKVFLSKSSVNNTKVDSAALNALDGVFEVQWEDSRSTNELQTEDILADENRPVEVAAILESEGYRDFDPFSNPDRLTNVVYNNIYSDFIAKAKNLLTLPSDPNDE